MSKKILESYPVVFSKAPVERIWGGNLINNLFVNNKNNLGIRQDKVYGELWLVSDRDEVQTTVLNGILKGLTINELWNNYGEELFGVSNTQNSRFPLLIKIIDAAEDLSLQVHPTKNYVNKCKNIEPKTEMWYIINSSNNAKVLAGFKKDTKIDKNKFKNIVNNIVELKDVVNEFDSTKNSYFFIPSGTIHAVGKNNLVFEIQQNSDTTYRVSDWGRVDKNGKSRDLHIKESLECINFTDESIFFNKVSDNIVYEKELSPKNKYFRLFLYKINKENIIDTIKSYKLLTLISGKMNIKFNNKTTVLSEEFTTVLLPVNNKYSVECLTEEVLFLCYYS